MFRALLAQPQEELDKRYLAYCVHIMLAGCGTGAAKLQPTDIIRTKYTKCFCVATPEDEQVMLETCRGH
jgi:hypothetical protein